MYKTTWTILRLITAANEQSVRAEGSTEAKKINNQN